MDEIILQEMLSDAEQVVSRPPTSLINFRGAANCAQIQARKEETHMYTSGFI